MLGGVTTKTDVAIDEWVATDAVVRIRVWGSDIVYPLEDQNVDATVGASDSCGLRIEDPSGRVSRLHARLVRDGARWVLRDLGSKNGLRLDGARRLEVALEPGLELGLGGMTLIAESSRSIELRGFLARMLGWRTDRIEAVDHALRAVRMAAAGRAALALCGGGDLVPTARSIHDHALGRDRPFVVCDPRRRQGKATVRSAQNYETGVAAYEAAQGGSLCVRSRRLPRDFDRVLGALRSPAARVQLIVCADEATDFAAMLAAPIAVPSLESRGAELDRIITEYADDAIAQLGTRGTGFLAVDREWVRIHAATSLPEIEKATRRLVALRESRNLTSAAARLGMAPVSLSRWIGRRSLPIQLEH